VCIITHTQKTSKKQQEPQKHEVFVGVVVLCVILRDYMYDSPSHPP
jgi:hypothetical protein